MSEKDTKKVYVVPKDTIEEKNFFNDTDKYGFTLDEGQIGIGNSQGRNGFVLFRPIAVPYDSVLYNKLLEMLADEEVYKYFKMNNLLEDLKKHGIRYKGMGEGNHKPFLWKGGKKFIAQNWYVCIDYREEPTLLTIRCFILPFFEFGNVEIIDTFFPDAKKWLEEGKLRIEDSSVVKERMLREAEELEKQRNERRNIGKA